MRNLAGRLTARSINELLRIAEFWQTPVTGRDRHAVVGQLYREMREMRTARDVWERLSVPERNLLLLLALDDRGGDLSRTLPELATALHMDHEATRGVAVSLYRHGMLYREGDADELPIGEMPRVFLPRELTAVFRRVQDEIDAGPLTNAPFSALLALLDDAEIEQAAQMWGLQVVPGLDDREDIAAQLVRAIGEEPRRSRIIAGLGKDARGLWEQLAGQPDRAAPLAELLATGALDGEGAVAALRRRNAIGQLEERLLVWHSYDRDERRWLFVPDVISDGVRIIERSAVRPEPRDNAEVTGDPWIHPFAVPWDMLTLLRRLFDPQRESIVRFEEASDRWLQGTDDLLWNKGSDDRPIAGYLAFLAGLGRNENVFQGGGVGTDEQIGPGRSWKTWRARGFADQFSHLVWWWNASQDWIEAAAQAAIIVRNAALPQFRRKVLVLLAGLDDDRWYSVEDVSRWIVELDPDILGDDASIAMAASLPVSPGHPDWGRLASAEVVRTTLQTAFAWFGLIDTGRDAHRAPVVRKTAMLRMLESAKPIEDEADPAGPAITVADDLVIELRAPAPRRIWVISAFAEQRSLRPVATYQLTEGALQKALRRGAALSDVTRFLERESGEPLSPAARDRILSWPSLQRNAALHVEVVIEPAHEDQVPIIERILREAGRTVTTVHEGRIRIELNALAGYDEQMREIKGVLTGAEFSTHTQGPPFAPIVSDVESGDPLA